MQLFRSLSLRQILGLQLAWVSSIGFVFALTTWLGERGFTPTSSDSVPISISLRWELGAGQILAVVAVLVAPMVLWLAVRERTPRK